MHYIDEKFKDMKPAETVAKIQGILQSVGIDVDETWHESGVDHCFSLSLSAKGGAPFSNGKGVSKEFARASAYGEFIERLQGGLFFYKYQSIERDADMDIQKFAPDAKYMTVEELEENGEWMDPIIQAFHNPRVNRKSIAEQCKIYACADDGNVLTLPFYSLFENKYIYLPIGFVNQIYATNGCCAGNTREEAWVHAFSEMMERNASLSMLTSGRSAPKISEEVLDRYPVVSKIIKEIRSSGDFDVDVFDYSIGNGFPIVSTRIINKNNHSYRVNVAADPVFEIALQRTLTELFQGKNVNTITLSHSGRILSKVSDFSITSNVINQLETGSGLYTADFFANELTCTRKPTDFADNSNKTNKELLDHLLGLYRELGKPVYVRNFSYLGFPCYRFVVPGFSEALSVRLTELVPRYAIADSVCKTLKNPLCASDDDLNWLLSYNDMISNVRGRYHLFGRISGVPITGEANLLLACVTRAYAAYRVGRYSSAAKYMEPYIRSRDSGDELKTYFSCVNKYVELKAMDIAEEKIRVILGKFFESACFERLYQNLDKGASPYDEFLMKCDLASCDGCRYNDCCCYQSVKELNIRVGNVYRSFVNGQNESEFAI